VDERGPCTVDAAPLLVGILTTLRQFHGRAVHVDPMKPTLKAPGTRRLKVKHDEPLSTFAFSFNLRRCTTRSTPPRICG